MTRVLIIVPANNRNAVNAAIRSTGIDSGPADNLTVGLWNIDDDQAIKAPSFYWCSWNMTDDQLTKLRGIGNDHSPIDIYAYDLDAQPDYPQQVLAQRGLTTATGGPL